MSKPETDLCHLLAANEPEQRCNGAVCSRLSADELASEYTNTQVDTSALTTLGRSLLLALGENPDRDGLRDTPARWANWWREFIEYHDSKTDVTFVSTANSIVAVSGIRVYSVCEHHLLPFWADVCIAYIPNGCILGLSKFARIAHFYAHRLGTQENLVENIHRHIAAVSRSQDVMVYAKGVHTCMIMRGIKSDGQMTTLKVSGRFTDTQNQHMILNMIK